MRVGIIALGSRGDIQPYVALGKGLQKAGYEVCVLTHGAFEGLVQSEQLEFFDVGGDPRALVDHVMNENNAKNKPNEIVIMSKLLPLLRPLGREILERCWQRCQDVDALVLNVLGIVMGVPIAQKRGIPAFPAYLQPMTPTREFPALSFPAVPAWLNPQIKPIYNRLSAEFLDWLRWQIYRSWGHAVHELLGMHMRSPMTLFRELHTPTFYGFSESFVPRPRDWPDYCSITGYWFLDAHAGWQPSVELQTFLQAGTPPIYIGFGSMGSGDAQHLTEKVVKALSLSGQRGIVMTGWGALKSEELPETVFAVDDVPHDWLFPQMAAVVHHGGAGTTAAGLRAGVPAIIIPFMSDQPFWGDLVHKRGVGPKPIHQRRLSAEALARAITEAVNNQDMRDHAAVLGKKIRKEDGVGNAVRLFQKFVS